MFSTPHSALDYGIVCVFTLSMCVCACALMVSCISQCGSSWSRDKEVAFSQPPLRKHVSHVLMAKGGTDLSYDPSPHSSALDHHFHTHLSPPSVTPPIRSVTLSFRSLLLLPAVCL